MLFDILAKKCFSLLGMHIVFVLRLCIPAYRTLSALKRRAWTQFVRRFQRYDLLSQEWRMYAGCAQRTGAAARESLQRNLLKSPAFHACGSASPFLHAVVTVIRNKWLHHPLRLTKLFMGTTTGCQSFNQMAQCVVDALKGLACRARVTSARSPASHCKQCSVLTSPSLYARGCASPSRAR
jgi:hypothetical protein